LVALLDIVINGSGMADTTIAMLSLFAAGTALQGGTEGFFLADSGLMVLATRLQGRRILNDYFLMWGLVALSRPRPSGIARHATPGAHAALWT